MRIIKSIKAIAIDWWMELAANLISDLASWLFSKFPNTFNHLMGTFLARFLLRRKLEDLFEPIPQRPLLKPDSAPSLFLREEHRIVTFRGREEEFEELRAWAFDGMGENVSVALVTGGPGRGKSRLARELCESAVKKNSRAWVARFLREDPGHEGHKYFGHLMAQPKPLLLVIDYAEQRTTQVAELVSAALAAERGGHPVRFLLLARAEGEWIKDIKDEGKFHRHPSNPFDRVKFRELRPIETGSRAQEFEHALIKFREFLNMDTAGTLSGIPNDLQQAEKVEILDIHIAALLAADGNGKNDGTQQVGSYEERLLSGLMDRERQIWKKHGLEGGTIRSAIAWMAVTNGLTTEKKALKRLRLLPNFRGKKMRHRVAKTLQALYPGNAWWGGVKPDRLTTWMAHEELAGMIKEKPEIVAKLPDDALVNLLRHLMWSVQHYGSKQDRQALESAIRAGGGRGIVAAAEVEVEAGALVDRIVAEIFSKMKDAKVAREVSDLIDNETVKASDEERAKHANNLSIRLSRLGRHEEALTAIQGATAFYRRLAEVQPAFRPDLATSLNNLSVCLSGLGRREDALAASEETVAIHRKLAETRSGFHPYLAMSLDNLSIYLSDLGRREDALAASEEAVAIHREPAESRPDAFRPGLAASLNNLSVRLSDLGRREDALAAIEEAVALRRELAESRPEAFRPDLAKSLNNLGTRLFDLGQREEAVVAVEEAVALRRELAESRPGAFRPDLATSLNNLGGFLSALGRREDALAAVEEAVALRRELAESRPEAFRPDLAKSLNNLGACLSVLGRHEAAVAAIEEAVAINRELAGPQPDLAMSLTNLSTCLSDFGRHETALAAIEEVVAIYRELAEARPGVFRPALVMSLNNLSVRLSDIERREDALAAIEEAVAILRELAGARPDAFRPDLAKSLDNLGACLSDLGRREAALVTSEEAVAIHRELAGTRTDEFRSGLAGSLNNLSLRLFSLERREDALVAIEEAVAIFRELASRRDAFRPDLVKSLRTLRAILSALGRKEEALKIAKIHPGNL